MVMAEYIYSRLDRAMGNQRWLSTFPESSVAVLPRLKFADHNPPPLVVHISPSPSLRQRPLRFEAAWMSHKDYQRLIQSNWKTLSPLEETLAQLLVELKEWKKSTFGHIQSRKKILMARMKGIQEAITYPSSSYLRELEKVLQDELDEVLYQEDKLCFQKQEGNGSIKVTERLVTQTPTPIISDTPSDISVANSPANINEFTYICEERCLIIVCNMIQNLIGKISSVVLSNSQSSSVDMGKLFIVDHRLIPVSVILIHV